MEAADVDQTVQGMASNGENLVCKRKYFEFCLVFVETTISFVAVWKHPFQILTSEVLLSFHSLLHTIPKQIFKVPTSCIILGFSSVCLLSNYYVLFFFNLHIHFIMTLPITHIHIALHVTLVITSPLTSSSFTSVNYFEYEF